MAAAHRMGPFPLVLLAVLLLSPLLGVANSRQAGPPNPSPAALDRAEGHAWTPLSKTSSPGAPRDRLVTTPLRPIGSYLGSVESPAWLAFDPGTRSFWVAALPSSVDEILANDTTSIDAAVPVGTSPFDVAVDSATGNVFVTNTGSDNVSVVSPTSDSSIGSVTTGNAPMGIAYDSSNGELYVADSGSQNVTVIDGTTLAVVATIAVGLDPIGIAIDPATGHVFVANEGSYSVSVISDAGNQVVATTPVGADPYGVAVDNATDDVYVTNPGSYNISVLNASSGTVVATIPVLSDNIQLQGLAYDSSTRQIWVGAGFTYLILVNTSSEEVASYLTDDPSGVAYDPQTGVMCVTNTYNATFECVLPPLGGYGSNGATLTFHETGLPTGTTWQVGADLNAVAASNSSQISFAPCAGGPCSSDYRFSIPPVGSLLPSPSSGWANFTSVSTPLSFNITFAPGSSLYHVTFGELGLPVGAGWQVDLNGFLEESAGSALDFLAPNGSYSFGIEVPGYFESLSSGQLTVHGANVTQPITFDLAEAEVSFSEYGLPSGAPWYVNFTAGPTGFTLPSSGAILTDYYYVPLPNGTFSFTVQSGVAGYLTTENRTVLVYLGSVLPSGSTQINFVAESFPVSFVETGLPARAAWSVWIGGLTYTTTGVADQLNETDGDYHFNNVSSAGFAADPDSGWVNITGAPPPVVRIVFTSTETFPVRFHETGLPAGTGWAVAVGSSVESSLTSNLSFDEFNGSYTYLVFDVPGYTTTYFGAFSVNGTAVGVSVPFLPQTYPVVVVEYGLPNGTNWSITVTNASTGFSATHSTTGAAMIFYLPNGSFDLSVTLPTGYTAVVSPATITVAGGILSTPAVHASRSASPTSNTPSTAPGVPWAWWAPAGAAALFGLASVLLWRRRHRSRPGAVAPTLPPAR